MIPTQEFFDKVDKIAKQNGFENEYIILAVREDGRHTYSHSWNPKKERSSLIERVKSLLKD